MLRRMLFLACCALALPATAFEEPARGTQLRRDLMDAMRPIAEWNLGAQVEFVVQELRVSGDVAFAMLAAQRPGGGLIDIRTTPMVTRDELEPEYIDGPSLQALLKRSGRMWVAVNHATGPTDAWWYWKEYCPIWHAVLPEVCQ